MYKIADAEIEYNRSSKEWQLKLGRYCVAYPAGKNGKAAAMLNALFLVNRPVAELVKRVQKRNPHLGYRAINAGLLYHYDHVRSVHPDHKRMKSHILAEVLSQSKSRKDKGLTVYSIMRENGVLFCGCDDYGKELLGKTSRPICKHVIAYQMALVLDDLRYIDWRREDIDMTHRSGTVRSWVYVGNPQAIAI